MEFNFQKATGLLIILLISSVGANFYQYNSHQKQDTTQQKIIAQLEESKQKYEKENEDYLNYIKNIDSSDHENQVKKQEDIKNFCLKYFTFSTDNEEKRLQNVSSYITDKLKEKMETLLDTEGDYEYSENPEYTLTASDVEVYSGNPNEYLATFKVKYESDIESESKKIYTMKLKINEEKISDFTIISVQDEGIMTHD